MGTLLPRVAVLNREQVLPRSAGRPPPAFIRFYAASTHTVECSTDPAKSLRHVMAQEVAEG